MKLARLASGAEIFRSLQGEGPSQGLPCTFVRTSRCNLHCGFCDTPYTWNWHGARFATEQGPQPHAPLPRFSPESETVNLSAREVAAAVHAWPVGRVVITGGEPLLQQAECVEMIQALLEKDQAYTFEIETNGTLVPTPELGRWVHHFTVSPKLSGSLVASKLRLSETALESFSRNPKSFFKFVVCSEVELAEVDTIVKRYAIEKQRVYLMPEARSSQELDRRSPQVAELSLRRGYRFSDRLHLRLYGAERGT